ncbi:MAG: 30S ribosomal protein S21 [Patescibacteria group bacterium]|nr:30S ribosomal protein S21 [Patescibacteria group bacterium]MDD5715711.1 30S ribosomal protein S21 [Patescibacteria group bacterium]
MPVEVRRKEGESPESLVRRFTKKVQASGVLIRAKRGRFHERTKSKLKLKQEATRRKMIRDKKELLRKIGKLDDFIDPRRPKKRGTIKKILEARVRW